MGKYLAAEHKREVTYEKGIWPNLQIDSRRATMELRWKKEVNPKLDENLQELSVPILATELDCGTINTVNNFVNVKWGWIED